MLDELQVKEAASRKKSNNIVERLTTIMFAAILASLG